MCSDGAGSPVDLFGYHKRSKTRVSLGSTHVVLHEERCRNESCPRKNEGGDDCGRAVFAYRLDLFGRAERVGHANERIGLRLVVEEGAAGQEENLLSESFVVDQFSGVANTVDLQPDEHAGSRLSEGDHA